MPMPRCRLAGTGREEGAAGLGRAEVRERAGHEAAVDAAVGLIRQQRLQRAAECAHALGTQRPLLAELQLR